MAFINVQGGAAAGPYRCPCCGFITLAERGAYEICRVCFWEDENTTRASEAPELSLSLREARRNYQETRSAASSPDAQQPTNSLYPSLPCGNPTRSTSGEMPVPELP
ncbi:CPCC family cysteine-rich protein [Streptomyces aureus]|uniref:CPCC family cysteine-rich protein n=1 Tax=Streptomyces aureus TaxID=193461 RepID=UPI0033EBF087